MTVDELLELSDHEEASKRVEAADAMGKLDEQFAPVMDRLREMSENDPDGDVRTRSANALTLLSSKGMAAEYASTDAGVVGTAFDDKAGDTSLAPGEFDVESSMAKTQEDRMEAKAEGKGLFVVIKETNNITLNSNGEKIEQGQSSGKVMVQNTGSENRITGVDLVLSNVDMVTSDTDLTDKVHIGVLAPGVDRAYSLGYNFEKEADAIEITQEYYDPETGLSPSFLGAVDRDFEAKIVITNTSDETVYNVHGEKELNELAKLQGTSISTGDISTEERKVVFDIEELEPNSTVEVIIQLQASLPEDVPSYKAQPLNVTYESKDMLVSGLAFKSIDGVSDIRQRVKRKQREEEPTFYDCEIILENKSEFVYDLNRFSVFAGDLESQQIVLDWDGEEASEDEREIVPQEKVAFEFVFESPDRTPTFGNHTEFSVQSEVQIATATSVTIPAEDLKFMAISISKAFLGEDDMEMTDYEVPSYVETEVPTLVKLTGVGSYPLEGLVIKDQIPDGFRAPETTDVSVMRNNAELASGNYEVTVGSDDTGVSALIVSILHLEETEEGGLKEDETISVKYSVTADNPKPQEEPIRAQAFGEGFIYEDENSKVRAESELEGLNLIVVHKRDDIDIGKFIQAIDHSGRDAYRITLEAENMGTSTVNLNIQDLIPTGFELVSDTLSTEPDEAEYTDLTSGTEGMVHGWSFNNIEPDTSVTASYVVVETVEDADPRKLQSVYKG